jgi:hypothetical protein
MHTIWHRLPNTSSVYCIYLNLLANLCSLRTPTFSYFYLLRGVIFFSFSRWIHTMWNHLPNYQFTLLHISKFYLLIFLLRTPDIFIFLPAEWRPFLFFLTFSRWIHTMWHRLPNYQFSLLHISKFYLQNVVNYAHLTFSYSYLLNGVIFSQVNTYNVASPF